MDPIEIKWEPGYRYRSGPSSLPHMRGIAITLRKAGPQLNTALRLFPINTVGISTTSFIEIPVDRAQEVAHVLVRAAQQATGTSGPLSVEDLMDKYGPWNEHPVYGRFDWKQLVASSETQRGYWSWVEAMLEIEASRRAGCEMEEI